MTIRTFPIDGMHTPEQPANDAAEVTPNNSADLATTPTRGLYIGDVSGGGGLKVTMWGGIDKDGNAITGATVTLAGVVAGSILPLRVVRVFDTGTTAASIVALY